MYGDLQLIYLQWWSVENNDNYYIDSVVISIGRHGRQEILTTFPILNNSDLYIQEYANYNKTLPA